MSYSLESDLDGTTYRYSDDPGQDGPHKTGYLVWIEPETIVVQYGGVNSAAVNNVAMPHLPPHAVRLYQDGVLVKSWQTPTHYWGTLWWHKLVGDRAFRDPAAIVAAKLLPPYGPLIPNDPPPAPTNKWPGPFDLAGLVAYEGTTGERPEIGFLHEASSCFMATGKDGPMLEVAQGLMAFQTFYIDDRTGRYWNLLDYPKATTLGNRNTDPTKPWYVVRPQAGCPNSWDVGHHPEPALAAYFRTGMVRYLRLIHGVANHCFLWADFHYGLEEAYPTLPNGQARSMGHAWRSLIGAYLAALDYEQRVGPVPPPCLPSAYWRQMILNQAMHLNNTYMNNPAVDRFGFYPAVGWASPWQQDHINNALPTVAIHFPELRPLYNWGVKRNLLPRVDGKSGWPESMSSIYRIGTGARFITNNYIKPESDTGDPLNTKTTDLFTNWQDLTNANLDAIIQHNGGVNVTAAQAQAVIADPTNGGDWVIENTYDHFIAHNALTQYVRLMRMGIVDPMPEYTVAEVEAIYARQHAMAIRYDTPRSNVIPWRQSTILDVPPLPTTPLPQPNHGDISMPAPAFGATFTATAKFYDNANIERPVDSVDWSASGAATLDAQQTASQLTITGKYTGTGAFEIDAVGHAGGNIIPLKVTGSVPVPFPTHGEIILS